MKRYKFQGDYRLRQLFQREFSCCIKAQHRIAIPIPVHPQTLQIRGFNQVQGLLADDVPVLKILETNRDRKSVPQSRKNRHQRFNLKQPFHLKKAGASKIKGQKVLIVDDVYTTGTTIRHAADLVRKAGARSVSGMTLSR